MSQICEYCRLLGQRQGAARSAKELRHVRARIKLHVKMVHRNPPSKRRLKIARVAFKVAFKLYKHFKHTGVPEFVIDRLPAEIRPYVVATLEANNIKVIKKNPRKRRK